MHKRKRSIAIKCGVSPTKERHQHNGGVYSEIIARDNGKARITRYRAVWECPLDAYYDRNLITKPEYRAGLRFRRAYYGAVICRRADCKPTSKEQASMAITMNDRLLDAAYETVASADMETVIDVCGHSKPAWSPQALEKLKRGLGHLATLWNMAVIEVTEH